MSMLLIKCFSAGLAGTFVETNYAPTLGVGSLGLPKLYGMTPAILSGMSFWILVHGLVNVKRARIKYSGLAKKDGENDVDERYGYPNLYAQGTSKHAKAFNCVQRSHQQIFETFPQMCLMSMVGAVHYPIMAATTTLAYSIGRYYYSIGYATAVEDVSKRNSNPLTSLMWYGYLTAVVVSTLSSASFIAGEPVL